MSDNNINTKPAVLIDRVTLDRPTMIPADFKLESSLSSDYKKIQIGDQDIYVSHISVVVLDANGKDITQSQEIARDDIRIDIKSSLSDYNLTKEPISIYALNARSFRELGWSFASRTELQVTVSGNGFPTTAKGVYPLKVMITFHAFRLV